MSDLLEKVNLLMLLAKQLRDSAEIHRKKALMHRNKAKKLIMLLVVQSSWPRNRIISRLNRKSKFWEEEVPSNSEKKFKEDFRMTRTNFKLLMDSLSSIEKQPTNFQNSIPLDKRIAIALYALASSSEYRTIANIFGVGRTTVGEILLEFCEAVCKIFEKEYFDFYPPSQAKINELVKGFEKWGFPQTYGAVDGTHIEVEPPEELASDYYNYKGWYSVILLAAVDYRYRFTYINIGSPGKNNDSYVFEKSALKLQHENKELFYQNSKIINDTEVPVLLIGDSAFRLSSYLMKPFPGIYQSEAESLYNKILSRSRRVVENAFGHLKARFRRIGRGLQVHIDNVPVIVRACCILHNILNVHNDKINKEWLQEFRRHENKNIQPQFVTAVGNRDASANEIRKSISKFLYEKYKQGSTIRNADEDIFRFGE